ncbi:MAG TPA: AAA family ATPase [Gemmatimonadaceae bacterium]|nr:AAA family ATPase [Gemmatimonadaceae bacterium]
MSSSDLLHPPQASLAPFPLVGRAAELAALHTLLDDAEKAHGRTVFLSGEPGIGKTRLSEELAREALRRNWTVAVGRAYGVESGVPYAPFADALLPILRALPPATVATLSRGGASELALLFPLLRIDTPTGPPSVVIGDPAELKTRLFWTLLQFLIRYAEKTPLLIVLENLHWTDPSSLELLHFISRQIGSARIAILCTYSSSERENSQVLRAAEHSLVGVRLATSLQLTGLAESATTELLRRVFGATEDTVREFASMLYGSTRGNPLFLEQTIKSLVGSGRLRQRDGSWQGWELNDLQLPEYIRDVFLARLQRLSSAARIVAELAAVVGVRVSHDLLLAVCSLPREALLGAISELRRADVLLESTEDRDIVYDFTHPLLRETVHGELGQARARVLHARVAECMETHYGADALRHASELAYHLVRSDARELDPKAIKFLRAAGTHAAARHAHREAASYLQTAFELAQRGESDAEQRADLIEELARAKQNSGDFRSALALWYQAQRDASAANALPRLAAIERRLGNLHYSQGRFVEALAHYDMGIAAAERSHDDLALAKLLTSKTTSLEALGDTKAQEKALRDALAIAEHLDDKKLLARVHRASALFYLWLGMKDRSASHATNALEFAQASGEPAEAWSAHWALAVLSALTGDAVATKHHLVEARRIADELHSPVLHLRVDEIEIEYKSSTGDWDGLVEQSTRSIALARALEQRTLLPRLLVYSGILSLGRGRIEEGKRYLDEAFALSGAAYPDNRLGDVHTLVRVYAGMAIYHLTMGEYDEVMRCGLIGLAVADRSGYAPWSVHRLLPTMIEALFWKQDFALADFYCKRLRHDSERVGQRIGVILAEVSEAMSLMLRGTTQPLLDGVIAAVEKMETIPLAFDGARLRLEIARRHVELGDRENAIRQLNRAFDTLSRLGAASELERAKSQLRELDARPRARRASTGSQLLSPREKEILLFVLQHKSNKEIAKLLGCAHRNVGKHLENACRKLDSHNRHEAAERARAIELI